jgi:MoaA/NifB/PqqE/SkfB family radical SAM enzyme
MFSAEQAILIVGKVPRRILNETVPAGTRTVRISLPDAAPDPFPQVIAEAGFDCFRFLDFANHLVSLRNAVAVGGTLVLVRRIRGIRDGFFCFRDDTFFRDELPAAWEADFGQVSLRESRGCLVLEMRNRHPAEEAARRLDALPHGSRARLFQLAEGSPLPRFIWTAATTRCNIRCRTCSIGNSPPGKDMSDEVIDRIFDSVGPHVDVVNVTGIGEPLFSGTWKHLYSRIRERPHRWMEVVSNGILLREADIRDMMKPENPTLLLISIDGNSKETYEFVRDRAKWEQVLGAMDMIKRLRNELKPGTHFALAVDFVAVKDNVHELPGLIERLAGWGVNMVIVIEMGDWETNREFFSTQALRFHPELANKYYALARAEAAKHPFAVVSIPPDYSTDVIALQAATPPPGADRTPLPRRVFRRLVNTLRGNRTSRAFARAMLRALVACLRNPVLAPPRLAARLRRQAALVQYETLGDFKRVKGYCSVVAERAYFHANGDIATCCGIPFAMFGNIRQEDFTAVWNSPQLREFRIMNLLGYPHSGCYFCTLPFGLPEKNPENFLAAHRLPPGTNRLARILRRLRRELAEECEKGAAPGA